jgi:glycosyltransferase involved in cell wall biosynthesis
MVSDECKEGGTNVHWWRRPTDAELLELYKRAWAFCLPSAYEGFGMPYAEAMAVGTPVVATPNPGARYVLDDGRAGLIVDEHALGYTLVELLTNLSLRSRLAAAGRKRVQEFSWTSVVRAHEHAYAEAIRDWDRRRQERT